MKNPITCFVLSLFAVGFVSETGFGQNFQVQNGGQRVQQNQRFPSGQGSQPSFRQYGNPAITYGEWSEWKPIGGQTQVNPNQWRRGQTYHWEVKTQWSKAPCKIHWSGLDSNPSPVGGRVGGGTGNPIGGGQGGTGTSSPFGSGQGSGGTVNPFGSGQGSGQGSGGTVNPFGSGQGSGQGGGGTVNPFGSGQSSRGTVNPFGTVPRP